MLGFTDLEVFKNFLIPPLEGPLTPTKTTFWLSEKLLITSIDKFWKLCWHQNFARCRQCTLEYFKWDFLSVEFLSDIILLSSELDAMYDTLTQCTLAWVSEYISALLTSVSIFLYALTLRNTLPRQMPVEHMAEISSIIFYWDWQQRFVCSVVFAPELLSDEAWGWKECSCCV